MTLTRLEHRGTEHTENKSDSVHSVPLCSIKVFCDFMVQITLAA